MSTILAPTRNQYGMRRDYRPRAVGLHGVIPRGPAEVPPRAYQFATRGLAAVTSTQPTTTALVPLNAPEPPILCPSWGCGGTLPPIQRFSYSPTPISQPSAPVTSTQPTITSRPAQPSPIQGRAQQYVDPLGNIYTLQNGAWVLTTPGPATQETPTPSTVAIAPTTTTVAISSGGAATSQPGTPVPVGWPTDQSYTDSSGNIWTFSAIGGWQITGTASSAAGGVATSTSVGDWAASITSWLQESTLISGVANFWLVAAVGGVGLVLYGMGRGKH